MRQKRRETLTKARKAFEFTQKDVARFLGILEEDYRAIELGRKNATKEEWAYLAKLFHIGVRRLKQMGGD